MKIVVLAGGLSSERDVSINSGTKICRALRERGHQAVLLDLFLGYGKEGDDLGGIFEGEAYLNELSEEIQTIEPDLEKVKALRGQDQDVLFGPNVVAICRAADIVYMGLHGADGENGKVQAAFDVLGIKYTGSDYMGSALAMDKGIAKKIFQAEGIPTPKGYTVTRNTIRPVPEEIGFPCVVKPCCGGSSVGVSMPENQEEYQKALEQAFHYEEEVVVEELIRGRELSVGVIAGKALPIIEIIPKAGFYDYETKYQAGMAEDVCPAELSEEITRTMQQWAEKVYQALKLNVYARVDFLLDGENRMYCLEANTLPGMTPTSLLPQEAREVGIEYGALCETIISESLKRYDASQMFVQPMEGMTIEAAAKAVGGTYFGPEEAKSKTLASITIDSRKAEPGCLFVAIKGQRVDGNDFIPAAYRDGALCCMSTVPPQGEELPYIQVESCEQALKDMAEYYLSILDVKVVGITGSVGKTTTKEMIASVLSQKYNTLKTLGNFNNEIGLPLTVFRLRPYHQVAVLEMGISDFGEMDRLAKIARPDMCVITNIGQCHLENLGDRDGVLRAKTEIFDYLKPEGTAYLNGDDDKLVTAVDDKRIQEPVYYGLDREGAGNSAASAPKIYAGKIQKLGLAGSRVEIIILEGMMEVTMEVTVPAPGRHMVSNALAATAVGLGLGLSLEEIRTGIEAYQPVGGHGHIIQTEKLTILDDCYNANPNSMKAGLDVLADVEERRVAILGDMFELGSEEQQMHYDIGAYAGEKEVDCIMVAGELAAQYEKGARETLLHNGWSLQESYGMEGSQSSATYQKSDRQIRVSYWKTMEELLDYLPEGIQPQDAVLVKASHGMHFEKIVEKLEE